MTQRTKKKNRKKLISVRLRGEEAPLRPHYSINKTQSTKITVINAFVIMVLSHFDKQQQQQQQWVARLKKEKAGSNTNQRHNPGTAASLGGDEGGGGGLCNKQWKDSETFPMVWGRWEGCPVDCRETEWQWWVGEGPCWVHLLALNTFFCLYIQGRWGCPDSLLIVLPIQEAKETSLPRCLFLRAPVTFLAPSSGGVGELQLYPRKPDLKSFFFFSVNVRRSSCLSEPDLLASTHCSCTHYKLNHSASRLRVGPSLCRALPLSAFSFTLCHHTSVTAPHCSHFLVQLLWEIRYFVFIL